ncbi:MAG TPA: GNAT family N-acetyltransferase [Spirochaetota bacterium]|nr:GNAT family N-acetyltransferase [Spirochaetota bacterium]HOR44163.1 GNAT family N-acetyltransferase [Spirochaetota bacterium]HPK55125.1 GNAT family N-acetyltransferase [Spirochaetota bacterium]
MITFKKLDSKEELSDALSVLKKSFKTVADEFGLTKENAPTNAAFMTLERLIETTGDGVSLFGLFENGILVGTVALEKSKENPEIFYLERLSVLPEKRHLGYGRKLMDFAKNRAAVEKAKKISIGVIDSNEILKSWYIEYGFKETMIKSYDHLPFKVCFMELNI